MQQGGNFGFLAARDSQLARLGALAESYFRSDPPAALLKLRLFGEALAKQVVARHGVTSSASATFDEVLREGRARGIFPQQVVDLLFQIKRWGNAAAHEDRGVRGERPDRPTAGGPTRRPGPYRGSRDTPARIVSHTY
mgnify:CR=1 FL=1